DSAFLEKLSRCEDRLRSEVLLNGTDGDARPGLTKVLSVADILDASTLGAIDKLPAFLREPALKTALEKMHAEMPEFLRTLVGTDPQTGKHYVRILLRSQERQRAEVKQHLINQVRQISEESFPGAEVTG